MAINGASAPAAICVTSQRTAIFGVAGKNRSIASELIEILAAASQNTRETNVPIGLVCPPHRHYYSDERDLFGCPAFAIVQATFENR